MPSIISNQGALPEVFSGNGICVNYAAKIDWVSAVNFCLDTKNYERMVKNCLNFKSRFDLDNEVNKLETLLT